MKITEQKREIKASLTEDGYTSTRVFRCSPEDSEKLNADEVLKQWNSITGAAIGDVHPVFQNIGITQISSEAEDTSVLVMQEYGLSERTSQQNRFGEEWVWNLGAQLTRITAVTAPSKQVHYPNPESNPELEPGATDFADIGTVIGWDGERVEGVQVYKPTLTLKVTKHFGGTDFFGTYGVPVDDGEDVGANDIEGKLQTAELLRNKTNNGPWKGYKQGEVLFAGGSVRQNGPDDWVIDYTFMIARQQDAFDLTLLSGLVVENIIVPPWEYGWGLNTQKTVGGATKNGIESFHVAQVYEEGDLTRLGLLGPR